MILRGTIKWFEREGENRGNVKVENWGKGKVENQGKVVISTHTISSVKLKRGLVISKGRSTVKGK